MLERHVRLDDHLDIENPHSQEDGTVAAFAFQESVIVTLMMVVKAGRRGYFDGDVAHVTIKEDDIKRMATDSAAKAYGLAQESQDSGIVARLQALKDSVDGLPGKLSD